MCSTSMALGMPTQDKQAPTSRNDLAVLARKSWSSITGNVEVVMAHRPWIGSLNIGSLQAEYGSF
jgi:hypothetical protein